MVPTCGTSAATAFLPKPVRATPLATPAAADRFKNSLLEKSDISFIPFLIDKEDIK